VRRSGGAGPDHRGDLRYDAPHDDLLPEQVPGAREHGNLIRVSASGIDPSAGGVDEPYERPPPAERHGTQPRDLFFPNLADAPAFDGEVVSGAADHSTTHFAESAHDRVRR